MIQVLCYTGRGFDTCWRPASIAENVVVLGVEGCPWFGLCPGEPYTPIRFFTGDFA